MQLPIPIIHKAQQVMWIQSTRFHYFTLQKNEVIMKNEVIYRRNP